MRFATYTDGDGRRWRRIVEDGDPPERARFGLHAGPPSLEALELPDAVEVRLHNQLHDRGIFSHADARKRTAEVIAAVAAAYGVDAVRVVNLYERWGKDDG